MTRIEAEGIDVVPSATARLRYALRLPTEETQERLYVVCGTPFVPRVSTVKTCGRSCGGRSRFVSDPVPSATCPDCGRPTCGLLRCQECHDRFGTVRGRLREIGVLGDKHIPTTYLPTASPVDPLLNGGTGISPRGYHATAFDGWARLTLPFGRVEVACTVMTSGATAGATAEVPS